MTADDIAAVISAGMCHTAEKRAECETCRGKLAAIEAVRAMAAEVWMVVRQLETQPPEAYRFDCEQDARVFHDRAAAQWTGVYLCRIVIDGGRRGGPPSVAQLRAQEIACLDEMSDAQRLRGRVAELEAEALVREDELRAMTAGRDHLRDTVTRLKRGSR